MKSNTFTAIRFILALLTLAALVGKPFIPPRTLLIYPSTETLTSLYGAKPEGAAKEAAYWLGDSRHDWRCHYRLEHGYDTCGIALSWTIAPAACTETTGIPTCSSEATETGLGWGVQGHQICILADLGPCTSDSYDVNTLDFSGYDGLKASIHYEGRAEFIRLVLQSDNPELRGELPTKFMSAHVRTEDLRTGPVFVDLREFSVEEWWTMMHNPPRDLAQAEFAHIRTINLDYLEHGVHRMRVDRLELVGERLPMETLLKALVVIWASYLLLEASFRYYRLYSTSRHREREINDLTHLAQDLEKEQHSLQERGITDALTQVYNRAGLAQCVGETFTRSLPPGTGLMMLDIDRFKTLNDRYGHDVGDQVLKELAQTVTACIREDDVFARWGGEEFILVTPPQSEDSLVAMGEKVRSAVAMQEFSRDFKLTVTLSIGITRARSRENFETAFKRADAALYQAKQKRNLVVFLT